MKHAFDLAGPDHLPPVETHFSLHDDLLGRQLFGRYSVEHGLVTVRSPYGHKCTQAGGSPPHHIAGLLLRELARTAASRR